MINSIVIVGRLTKDPKIYEKEGNKLATFCVAVSRNYKDKNQKLFVIIYFVRHSEKLLIMSKNISIKVHWLV